MNCLKPLESSPSKAPVGIPTKGTVKWFSDAKGFGFVTADVDCPANQESKTDIFVHYSAISSEGYKSIKEGQRIRFDLSTGPKGPQAFNVEVL